MLEKAGRKPKRGIRSRDP